MRRTRNVASRRARGELAVEQRGAFLVERRERLVEQEQRGSCRNTRQSASRWSIPRENDATRSFRASHRPNRSSSIPIRSRRSGTR